MNHTNLLVSALALTCALAGSPALQAQDFPTKSIRTVVAFAGGTPDAVARIVGSMISGSLGQSVVVEARPGAGGIVALQAVKQAPPDGYTLFLIDTSTWAIQPAVQPGSIDALKELIPIGQVITTALFLVVSDKTPARTVPEFIALAKSKPGALSYASAGNGTLHHLFMETFKTAAGINVLHVPFSKGVSEALPALLGGTTDALITSWPAIEPHVKTGRAHVLLASTQQRSPLAPHIPSLGDANIKGESFAGDMGYFVLAGTPRPVVDKLAATIAKAVTSTEFAERAKAYGFVPVFRGPEEFAEMVKSDVARYARAASTAGVKLK